MLVRSIMPSAQEVSVSSAAALAPGDMRMVVTMVTFESPLRCSAKREFRGGQLCDFLGWK